MYREHSLLVAEMQVLATELSTLLQRGVQYALVGGVALELSTDTVHEFYRPDGSIRDIDIIVLADPLGEAADYAQKRALLVKTGVVHIPIDFNFVRSATYYNPCQLLSHLAHDPRGGYRFVFRSVSQTFDASTVTTYRKQLRLDRSNFVEFQTFCPQTLLHLYVHRSGALKYKDRRKVLELSKMFGYASNHRLYRPYHDFGRTIRKVHPVIYRMLRTYTLFDHLVDGRLSKLLSHQARKTLIEL